MRNIKRAGILMVAATCTLFVGLSPAGATDLNCGDPGTSHNMPVGPDDPHGLDGDGDGLGCEDPSVFGPGPAPAPVPDPAPAPAPAPSPAPAPAQADLDCGDPGTSHNMRVGPGDPHGLDADDDGIGCEDGSVFEPAPAAPAEPQVREPAYTG
jgi:hypothetical protein